MRVRWWGWWRKPNMKSMPQPSPVMYEITAPGLEMQAQDEGLTTDDNARCSAFRSGAFGSPEEILPTAEEAVATCLAGLPEAWPFKSRSVCWLRRICLALMDEIVDTLKRCYAEYGDRDCFTGTKLKLSHECAGLRQLRRQIETNDESLCKAVIALIEQARRTDGAIYLAYSAMQAVQVDTALTTDLCQRIYKETLNRYSEWDCFEWVSRYVPYYFLVLPEHRPGMLRRLSCMSYQNQPMGTIYLDAQTGFLYTRDFPLAMTGRYITTGEYCAEPYCNYASVAALFGEDGKRCEGLSADHYREYL